MKALAAARKAPVTASGKDARRQRDRPAKARQQAERAAGAMLEQGAEERGVAAAEQADPELLALRWRRRGRATRGLQGAEWARVDSNHRPADYESAALTT